MKIVTIGGATYDIIIEYPQMITTDRQTPDGNQRFLMLEEGKKLEVTKVAYKTGGGATNSAVSFSRLGFGVEAFFKIGDDFQGKNIIESLHTNGVATTHIRSTQELPTSVSCILAGASSERTVLVYRGASLLLREDELPLDAIAQSRGVYITPLNGNAMKLLPIIAQKARHHNALVAVNPSSNQLKDDDLLLQALPMIDVLIMNHFEATLLVNSLNQQSSTKEVDSTIPLLFPPIMAHGPKIVVITDGADGVYVAHESTIYFHPSLPIKTVSTLGAGDAFGSAFTAGILLGKAIEDALRMGVINSSSVICYNDAQSGLLRVDEMVKRVGALDKVLLKRINLTCD